MLLSEMTSSRYMLTVSAPHLFPKSKTLTSARLGTFLKNVTDNATFTYTARYENYTEPAHGTLDFCTTAIDSIDQPVGPRKHECPPQEERFFFSLLLLLALSSCMGARHLIPTSKRRRIDSFPMRTPLHHGAEHSVRW